MFRRLALVALALATLASVEASHPDVAPSVDASNGTLVNVNVTVPVETIPVDQLSVRSVVVRPPNATLTPVPTKTRKHPTKHLSGSSSSDVDSDVVFPSGHGSSSGSWANSSDGSVNVGDVEFPGTVTVPETVRPAAPCVDVGSGPTDADANAQRAKDLNGQGSLFSAAAFVGFAGCAALVVGAIYTRARPDEPSTPVDPFVHDAPESIELRRTSSGVYNDPLGTRFSSIVMITPNGEGVCIL